MIDDNRKGVDEVGQKDRLLYVGTFTDKESEGIYLYHFNEESGELRYYDVVKQVADPSFITPGPDHTLYAINALFEYKGEPTGAVSAFSIERESGRLTLLNERSSRGRRPAYAFVDRSKNYVLLANYGEGSVVVFPILADGRLGEATDVVQHVGASVHPRQEGPHAHSIITDPSNSFALVADLGTDTVYVYRFDTEKGKLEPHRRYKAAAGAGPRHLAFHPSNRYLVIVHELNSTMTSYRWTEESGELTELETVSTLPHQADIENTAAEVKFSACGRFLYATNRGDNSIIFYTFQEETGKLRYVNHYDCKGEVPRHFTFSPDGRFLLVANQESDSIVSFHVNEDTGELTFTGNVTKAPTPVCLLFL
nr:lactonase family protein [Halalkalibacter oceani]